MPRDQHQKSDVGIQRPTTKEACIIALYAIGTALKKSD